MANATPSKKKHAAPPTPWIRHAFLHTALGTLLGLVTAAILVLTSHSVFPELADFDYDLGLRMQKFAREHMNSKVGLSPEKGAPDSYVFLDVDPQPAPAASFAATRDAALGESPACVAMAAGVSKPHQSDDAFPTPLKCSVDRPLNRYLLGQLTKELRERGAKLIVMDVELASEAGVVDSSESKFLREALWRRRPGQAQVIYARPAEYSGVDATGVERVLTDPSHTFDIPDGADASAITKGLNAAAIAAIAMPAPGQPVRRYPKCFQSDRYAEGLVPSLPYLAAALMLQPQGEAASLCAPTEDGKGEHDHESPRIRYTLPELRAHQDATGEDDDFRLWSFYHQVYARCLASSFWNSASPCGQTTYYQDKVVVIGASSRLRRDRHYTPIGNMAGAEVVINAIRSFVLFADEHEGTASHALVSKAGIVLACTVVWLLFYIVRGYAYRNIDKDSPWNQRLGAGTLSFVAFATALFAVLAITFRASSFTLLVGLLAIGIEQYVELVTTWILKPFERYVIRPILRLPKDSSAH